MRKIYFGAVMAMALIISSQLLDADDIEIKTKRSSDRIAVFTFGPYDTNITAIASEKGMIVIDTVIHPITPFTFWRQLTKTAAWEVEETAKTSGLEAARKRDVEMKSDDSNEYFFDESDFNLLGYRLLQENKIDNAIAVFKLNAEAYANSNNASDILRIFLIDE